MSSAKVWNEKSCVSFSRQSHEITLLNVFAGYEIENMNIHEEVEVCLETLEFPWEGAYTRLLAMTFS